MGKWSPSAKRLHLVAKQTIGELSELKIRSLDVIHPLLIFLSVFMLSATLQDWLPFYQEKERATRRRRAEKTYFK